MPPTSKAHPWHGVPLGDEAPLVVNAYIEIVPTDTVKYEIDKATGHLRVDRPQKYSNYCPTLYGFVPRTYCGQGIGDFCAQASGRTGIVGDEDPLDICILTEKVIIHGDILVKARPIGGLRLIDQGQADDKIIAVLLDDPAYGHFRSIKECPETLVDRLKHYFLTYKAFPRENGPPKVEIDIVYDE